MVETRKVDPGEFPSVLMLPPQVVLFLFPLGDGEKAKISLGLFHAGAPPACFDTAAHPIHLQRQHLAAQVGDGVNFPFVFSRIKRISPSFSILDRLPYSVPGAMRISPPVSASTCCTDAVTVPLPLQAQQDVKPGFGHGDIYFFDVSVHVTTLSRFDISHCDSMDSIALRAIAVKGVCRHLAGGGLCFLRNACGCGKIS